MNKNPLVSVVIVNHNYARFLTESIESVLRQSYKEIEIIVVDDASSDHSLDVIQHFGDVVKSIFLKVNVGVSKARNLGASCARGELIAFLDSDDSWAENKIELQVAKLSADSKIGLCYTGIRIIRNGDQDNWIFPTYKGNCSFLFRRYPMRAIALLVSSGAMVRADAFRKVQAFDESLSISADWDFSRRISDIYSFTFCNQTLTNYRIHGQNMSSQKATYLLDNLRAIIKMLKFDYVRKNYFYFVCGAYYSTLILTKTILKFVKLQLLRSKN